MPQTFSRANELTLQMIQVATTDIAQFHSLEMQHSSSANSSLEHPQQQQAYQPKEMIELVELIEALERKYRMIERELHPWPFNTLSLSEFLITTAIPLASTILTVIASFIIAK